MEEVYYLVENRNGFERPLEEGTEEHLCAHMPELKRAEASSDQAGYGRQAWEGCSYYIVTKTEWDREHCPLIPVDLS